MLRALGAGEHEVRVEEVADVVAGFRRVRFSSSTIFDGFDPGPTDYLRLWFPDPDDADREVQRGYTVIEPDAAAGTFAIDFVLHQPLGPASSWATTCAPGDTLLATVYGTKPFAPPSPEPAGYLFVGDAASVPAINSMIAALPPTASIEVLLEWGDEWELAIPVAEHPGATVRRLRRDLTGARVVAALADRDWTDWYAWVAAERSTSKAVRAALKDVHGFPKTDCKVQAYWIHGKSMGTSRGGSVKAAAKASANEAPPVDGDGAASSDEEPAPEPSGAGAGAGAAPVASSPSGAGRWRSQAGVEVLRPVRPTLRIAAVAQLVVTLAGLVPFVLLVEVSRRLLDGQPVEDQWPLARLALWIIGGAAVLEAALQLWLHHVDARFALDVRKRLLAKLAHLPLGWFTDRNSATVKQTVTDDTNRLHYYVTHAAVEVVGALAAPLAVLAYLFVVDARLAAVLLVPIIAYAYVFATMMQASGTKVNEVAAWSRRMNGEAVSYLDGLPVVRTFGGAAASGFRGTVDDYVEFLGDWQRPFVSRKATAALLTDAMTFLVIIVVVGGLMVTTDHLSPADLLPFLLLGTTFGGRLLALAYNASGLREARAAAQRIGLALTEPELETWPSPAAPGAAKAIDEVRLDRVTFGYQVERPVVHDIDLSLRRGTVTALVGPSGSGKSTLAALLARFHDPDQGTVTIDGTDIRTLSADELYRRVGFVLQDVHLVRGTLHDNIALARPDATRAEVAAAADQAVLGELVARLPDGFDTDVVGDVQLSGGEAQRVAIARAILADTPLVVLDEATAFADPDSEHQVQQALSQLVADRTVLVIAHRLHTIVDADRIVVLDGGRIVQSGTHDELVAVPGRYRELWLHSGQGVVR
jgi:ATP-binding cassette subfamily B protein IrtA